MLTSARKRAKDKGLAFNLTSADILIPDICPVLNIPLMRNKNVVGSNSPSLDRVDNSKGYTPGNVQIISNRANTLKNSASLEESIAITYYITQNTMPSFLAYRNNTFVC